ncbi:hypothetical protein M728_005675 (plasmid) [Ensifer sp. WSM1721]
MKLLAQQVEAIAAQLFETLAAPSPVNYPYIADSLQSFQFS